MIAGFLVFCFNPLGIYRFPATFMLYWFLNETFCMTTLSLL